MLWQCVGSPLVLRLPDHMESFLLLLALGFRLPLLMTQLVVPLTWDQKYYCQADPEGRLLVGTADRRGIKNLDKQDLSFIKRMFPNQDGETWGEVRREWGQVPSTNGSHCTPGTVSNVPRLSNNFPFKHVFPLALTSSNKIKKQANTQAIV